MQLVCHVAHFEWLSNKTGQMRLGWIFELNVIWQEKSFALLIFLMVVLRLSLVFLCTQKHPDYMCDVCSQAGWSDMFHTHYACNSQLL